MTDASQATNRASTEATNRVPREAVTSAESLLEFLTTTAFGHGVDGVEWLYQLASTRMRSKLGDLSVFRRAFSNELYAPLITHRRLKIVELASIDGTARAEVAVEVNSGEVITFVVALKLSRHGASAGDWQLSGVAREGVDL